MSSVGDTVHWMSRPNANPTPTSAPLPYEHWLDDTANLGLMLYRMRNDSRLQQHRQAGHRINVVNRTTPAVGSLSSNDFPSSLPPTVVDHSRHYKTNAGPPGPY